MEDVFKELLMVSIAEHGHVHTVALLNVLDTMFGRGSAQIIE